MPRFITYSSVSEPDSPFLPTSSGKKKNKKPIAKPNDGYTERLAKYVPAEVLAAFLPLSAFAASSRPWSLVVFGGCVVATPLVQLAYALASNAGRPPRHYYALCTIAFIAWAIGTSKALDDTILIPAIGATVVTGLAVVIVPAVDVIFAKWRA